MKEHKQFLRDKKSELYTRLLELTEDSDRLKKIAKQYSFQQSWKHKLLNLSYALDEQADEIDETCIAIETYLKIGRVDRQP